MEGRQPHRKGSVALRVSRPSGFSIPSDAKTLTVAFRTSLVLLVVLFIGQAITIPLNMRANPSGLEVLALPFGVRLAEALIAVVAVGLVTLVYSLLIHRGALIATTCLYPRRPIESNIGRLLDAAWPASTDVFDTVGRTGRSDRSIQLFYLGKMQNEPKDILVAKTQIQSKAEPVGTERRRGVWLTSGSQLTKLVVQVMVWEWVSFWLCVLMLVSSLMFNGFLTRNLNNDSFPRLTVMLIYVAAFSTHFFYVWIIFLNFFSMVFVGASWSLLERSKFVVAETLKLREHQPSMPFQFRSIDKANEAYIPTTFMATLASGTANYSGLSGDTITKDDKTSDASSTELALALGNINAAQKTEREHAMEASRLALDRVIANAMVMMAVTLSSGFASWTSAQFTEDTPNNTATNQIGSLALLGSLSLGAAAMFSSAMHLSIMTSSFRTIVSLKETKINGLALDHHRKIRTGTSLSTTSNLKPVAFTLLNSLKPSTIQLADFFAAKSSSGWIGVLSMALLGPGYALLPQLSDHGRMSEEVDFDFVAPVNGGEVVLTTRRTDRHAKEQGNGSLDPVVACYVPDQEYGKEVC